MTNNIKANLIMWYLIRTLQICGQNCDTWIMWIGLDKCVLYEHISNHTSSVFDIELDYINN